MCVCVCVCVCVARPQNKSSPECSAQWQILYCKLRNLGCNFTRDNYKIDKIKYNFISTSVQ